MWKRGRIQTRPIMGLTDDETEKNTAADPGWRFVTLGPEGGCAISSALVVLVSGKCQPFLAVQFQQEMMFGSELEGAVGIGVAARRKEKRCREHGAQQDARHHRNRLMTRASRHG
jgi:hypothetical protein